jgi:hypothetical protein
MPDLLGKNWLLNINGAPCNLFTGRDGESPPIAEGSPESGRGGTAKFVCAWEDRNQLLAGLVGTVSYVGGTIVRTPPFSWPTAAVDSIAVLGAGGQYPDRLVCLSVGTTQGIKWRSDPDGSISGLPGWGYYAYAVLTAEFGTPPYLTVPLATPGAAFSDLLGTPYCMTKTRVAGEVLSPPTGALVYDEGTYAGKPLADIDAGHVRVRYELSCTRIRMPIAPINTVAGLVGTVNAAAITLGTTVIPPGGALFTGMNPEVRCDQYNGGIIFDCELLWLCNGVNHDLGSVVDWNYFQDPSGAWVPVVEKGSDNPVFAYMDHSPLLDDAIS